jgi:hypothetical protein
MNLIKKTEKTKSKLQNLTKSQTFDQVRAQNTSLDLITANKSKQQPKSSLFKIMNLIKKLKKPNQNSKI